MPSVSDVCNRVRRASRSGKEDGWDRVLKAGLVWTNKVSGSPEKCFI